MQPNRRRSWLGPIQTLLTILLVLNVLSLPVSVFQWITGRYVIGAVDLHAVFPQGVPDLDDRHASLGRVELFWEPGGALQILLFAISQGFGAVLATLAMLVYARRTVREAREHDPFTPAMVRRLRTLGLLVLAGGLVYELAELIAGWALLHIALDRTGIASLGAQPDTLPTFWWLLPGLLVFAFAEVIRHGCALRAELDEVI
ncbi:MAG TPA: DUF2975 domain-containing protein [Micromonosporaceae bacterium]|nr:DUF2975 domain-containing protein [Micromonosporaceae bacterium]